MSSDTMAVSPGVPDLVTSIKESKCVLFVGSAIHAPPPADSKYTYAEEERPPLGSGLAKMLAEECGYRQKLPDDPPTDLQRVSLCFETDPNLRRSALVDRLDKYLRQGKKPSAAVRMLASLPFTIIVTTNYDQLLESALIESEKKKRPVVTVYNPTSGKRADDPYNDPTIERPLLFKMHGDLDHRESIVITDEDYIGFVQRMSESRQSYPVPDTVLYHMTKWPILFVGYSLRDYNLRLLFRTLRCQIDPVNMKPTYSVDRSPDPLILKVWQDNKQWVTFLVEDLWTFLPWLFKAVHGREFEP